MNQLTGFLDINRYAPGDEVIKPKLSDIAEGNLTVEQAFDLQIDDLQNAGYGKYPVCVAKTQYSFSTDPSLRGAPSDHIIPIREVRLAAGAEFIVMVCGDIMTMPGLPKVPAAEKIDLDANGNIVGLF